jgi:hypothetical protein
VGYPGPDALASFVSCREEVTTADCCDFAAISGLVVDKLRQHRRWSDWQVLRDCRDCRQCRMTGGPCRSFIVVEIG